MHRNPERQGEALTFFLHSLLGKSYSHLLKVLSALLGHSPSYQTSLGSDSSFASDFLILIFLEHFLGLQKKKTVQKV